MIDISSLAQWWDDWQLRILVLGSLGLQLFLLLAAPMRKYTIPQAFRTCIWLAYISSDALAIYALATLFNRHARTVPASICFAPPPGDGHRKEQSRILEVLWAPILLIHLGGQEELTAYKIEDSEQWARHAVTLVSQVAVALYAFYKSWQPSSSDWRLTAAAALLFVVGVFSFSEKPIALNRAKSSKIKRLAAVSAWIKETKKPSVRRQGLSLFSLFKWSRSSRVVLTDGDKVLLVLSDMSLLAAAKELAERSGAKKEEVLQPLLVFNTGEMVHWLRLAFGYAFPIIYTRASVVVPLLYLIHLVLVPVLHVAALTLFARSDKHGYKRADVKITYIVLCLTAAMDFLAVFIRHPVNRLISMTQVRALCETIPGYNLIGEAVREADKGIGWMYTCARYSICRPRHGDMYKKVVPHVLPDLVDLSNRDVASYRIFDSSTATTTNNWALSKQLQDKCGVEIKRNLDISFDRSVLLWHIATDLCFRCIDVADDGDGQREEEKQPQQQQEEPPDVLDEEAGEQGGGELEDEEIGARMDPALRLLIESTQAISNYMAHLLNSNPDMLLTGSRHHLISEARDEVKSTFLSNKVINEGLVGSSDSCSQLERPHPFSQKDPLKLKQLISDIAGGRVEENPGHTTQVFHIIKACKLANELLEIRDDATRWKLMYRVWLGMLCYSASMCRGYLHAKSLGEGGEFLSLVWLGLSLMGTKTLADKLQMPPETQASEE